jgi:TRAP-type uncharacterized transport system substrate-binding protein
MLTSKIYIERILSRLNALFGQGMAGTIIVILLIGFSLSATVFIFMQASVPDTITIASGPIGSTFQTTAEKYKKILAKNGITLNIVLTDGSHENFQKLADPKSKVDIGFVLGGQVNGANTDDLVSLGSISYQPLMIIGVIPNVLFPNSQD